MNLYKKLPSDDIKKIAAAMVNVTFGRGECIIEQGATGRCYVCDFHWNMRYV
jgi:hypothetical protein